MDVCEHHEWRITSKGEPPKKRKKKSIRPENLSAHKLKEKQNLFDSSKLLVFRKLEK